jgi:hypothetical protein
VVVVSTVTVTESTETLSAATVAVESVVVVVEDSVVDGLLQEANATTAKIAMNFFIFDFGFEFIC